MPKIKFGTDGWRAIIAKDFTFENLDIVARATAQWLKATYGPHPKAIIGHDTRFLGRQFLEYTARVFAAQDIKVVFADGVATTPAISWGTKEFGCDAGIVITASHNPPEYNGFKIKANFGGPASPDQIAAVEAEMDRLEERTPPHQTFEEYVHLGIIDLVDVQTDYENMLHTRLDVAAIIKSGIRIVHDAMYGAGQGAISRLLGPDMVVELRSDYNPGFKGQAPEPIEKNLQGLAQAVVETGAAVGLANDGDADRIGMFDENGAFVDSHQMLALLVKYLHEERGLRGDVVKTFSTTHMLDRIGERYGLKVHTTPIGFKYIGSMIVEGDVLVGGEESGGMAVKGHIPERDGIYIGLLVVEMMVKRGKKLSELVQELFDEFGPHYARRVDVHTTEEKKNAALAKLKAGGLKEISGVKVNEVQTLDGYKHLGADGWLLVRASGTEPVLRIYAETATPDQAEAMLHDAVEQLGVAGGH